MFMLNKKFILTFICLLISLFVYSESGEISFFDTTNPHHEYSFNNGGKQNRYRIQMGISHYAFFINPETCSYNECFPNFEMGIYREDGGDSTIKPNYSKLSIFPEIILKDENFKDVFSIKGKSMEEGGYNYNCYATDWKIYEKGLVLDVLLLDDFWNKTGPKKMKRFYLELKEDGKYYESENAERFGKLKERCSEYDLLNSSIFFNYIPFMYHGYSIYKMGSGKKIESVFISNILYYNKTDDGIEFITPCGCGFFDFKSESMSLVPKERYVGKEFIYAHYYKESRKTKEKKKIITEEDFILPDIRVPIRESELERYLNQKQRKEQEREESQLLKSELLPQ